MNADTFGKRDLVAYTVDEHVAERPQVQHTGRPDVRIYFSEGTGRRACEYQHVVSLNLPAATAYLRNELALFGKVGDADARLFGKVIHAIGTEGRTLAVHLRPRYNF